MPNPFDPAPALTGMTSTLPRFREETDRLATAGQPAAQDFPVLRTQGFDVVVNISTPTARNFLADEARIVIDAGMTYVHAPVDCTHLTPDHYAVVRGVLGAFPGKKVLLHCAGNVKASGLAHVYRVKELGEAAGPLRDALRRNDWHEAKWHEYFDAMGA